MGTERSKVDWAELAARRWTEEDAGVALAAWRRSGQSAYAFARGHGLNPQRLHWWAKRLAEWDAESEATSFVEAEVLARHGTGVGAPVRVHTRSGVLVEVETGAVDARWVATLVRELDESAR